VRKARITLEIGIEIILEFSQSEEGKSRFSELCFDWSKFNPISSLIELEAVITLAIADWQLAINFQPIRVKQFANALL